MVTPCEHLISYMHFLLKQTKSESESNGDGSAVTLASDTALKLPQTLESVNHLTRTDTAQHGAQDRDRSIRESRYQSGRAPGVLPSLHPGSMFPFSAGPTQAGEALQHGHEPVVVVRRGGSGCPEGWHHRHLQQRQGSGTGSACSAAVRSVHGHSNGDTTGQVRLRRAAFLLVPIGECDRSAVCALRRILVSIFMFCFNFKPQEDYRKCW